MSAAVLVPGAWSSPAGWRRVAARLHARGVQTIVPDLASHQDRSAGRLDDVTEVQTAIDATTAPVVVIGWSYGGKVITGLRYTSRVDRLVYLSWYPEPAETGGSDQSPDLDSPLPDDATLTLDDDSWLNGPVPPVPLQAVPLILTDFSSEPYSVSAHAAHQGRRAASRRGGPRW